MFLTSKYIWGQLPSILLPATFLLCRTIRARIDNLNRRSRTFSQKVLLCRKINFIGYRWVYEWITPTLLSKFKVTSAVKFIRVIRKSIYQHPIELFFLRGYLLYWVNDIHGLDHQCKLGKVPQRRSVYKYGG